MKRMPIPAFWDVNANSAADALAKADRRFGFHAWFIENRPNTPVFSGRFRLRPMLPETIGRRNP